MVYAESPRPLRHDGPAGHVRSLISGDWNVANAIASLVTRRMMKAITRGMLSSRAMERSRRLRARGRRRDRLRPVRTDPSGLPERFAVPPPTRAAPRRRQHHRRACQRRRRGGSRAASSPGPTRRCLSRAAARSQAGALSFAEASGCVNSLSVAIARRTMQHRIRTRLTTRDAGSLVAVWRLVPPVTRLRAVRR